MHAENGQSALEILRGGSKQIDLVLLDIVMPIMDGVEFLNIVKVGDDGVKNNVDTATPTD